MLFLFVFFNYRCYEFFFYMNMFIYTHAVTV